MARIRTIKPESSLSESLESVSILGALLFARLPCFADDDGRMRYSPARIKAQVFPMRDEVTRQMCADAVVELCDKRLIQVYESDGESYLSITGFAEHQKVSRPSPSLCPPPPPISQFNESSLSPHGAFSECSLNAHGVGSEESLNAHGVDGKQNENAEPSGDMHIFSEDSLNTHGALTEDSLTEREREREREVEKEREEERKASAKTPSSASDDTTENPSEDFARFAAKALEVYNEETGDGIRYFDGDAWHGLHRSFTAGRTIDDLRLVIRDKREEWAKDPKMCRYIRPSTLFGQKFEGYLAKAKKNQEKKGSFDEYE